MTLGNLSLALLFSFILVGLSNANSQEKIDLEGLQPTFEEETDLTDDEKKLQNFEIRSKNKKKIMTGETAIVHFRALDKITAKTSDISIPVGKKQKIGYLEVLPKKCKKAEDENSGVVAYIQVRDLSDKKDDKIFVFNGWTFSSRPTLQSFDHPVYDLWVLECDNI